jgi:hypothetical protein
MRGPTNSLHLNNTRNLFKLCKLPQQKQNVPVLIKDTQKKYPYRDTIPFKYAQMYMNVDCSMTRSLNFVRYT